MVEILIYFNVALFSRKTTTENMLFPSIHELNYSAEFLWSALHHGRYVDISIKKDRTLKTFLALGKKFRHRGLDGEFNYNISLNAST